MIVKRGDIWLADMNPTRGSEQAGMRPVLILQNDVINRFTTTVLSIPMTANLRRAALPSCVKIEKGEGCVLFTLPGKSQYLTPIMMSTSLKEIYTH